MPPTPDASPSASQRGAPGERIALIGPRGSGKTSVGRALAARLGWAFLDADVELESRAGCSIREVFAREGEVGFRDREAAVLAELCDRDRAVIATGGGAVLREANRARLRRAGMVVWLTADAPTLWARLQADASTEGRRPDLAGGGLAEVEDVLRVREPLYRACADFSLGSAARPPDALAAEVAARWLDRAAVPFPPEAR